MARDATEGLRHQWVEFPAATSEESSHEPVKWWYNVDRDELRWKAPQFAGSSIVEVRRLPEHSRSFVVNKARASRTAATAKKNRLLSTGKKLLKDKDFRGAAAAALNAYETAPSDSDRLELLRFVASTKFFVWTQISYLEPEKVHDLYSEYKKAGGNDPFALIQAGIVMIGMGLKSKALQVFISLMQTTAKKEAVLWCVALLKEAQRSKEALAYLSWSVEHLDQENTLLPAWIVHLLLAEMSSSPIAIKTSLRQAQRLSVDYLASSCLKLSQTEWFQDLRVWQTAANILFEQSHFLLAQTAYARSIVLLPKKYTSHLLNLSIRRAVCCRLAHEEERSLQIIQACLDTDHSNLNVRRLAAQWSNALGQVLENENLKLAKGPQALFRKYIAKKVYYTLKNEHSRARFEDMCLWQKAQPFVTKRLRRQLHLLFAEWLTQATILLRMRKAAGRIQNIYRLFAQRKFQRAVLRARRISKVWNFIQKKAAFFFWLKQIECLRTALIHNVVQGLVHATLVDFPRKHIAASSLQRSLRSYRVRSSLARRLHHSRTLSILLEIRLNAKNIKKQHAVFRALRSFAQATIHSRRNVAVRLLQKTIRKSLARRRLLVQQTPKQYEPPRYDLALVWFRCLRREAAASKIERGARCRMARKLIKKLRMKQRKAKNMARRNLKRWLAIVLRTWRQAHSEHRQYATLISALCRGYLARQVLVRKRIVWLERFELFSKGASRHRARLCAWSRAAKRLGAARGLLILSRQQLKSREERRALARERLMKLNIQRRERQLEVRCLEAWREETVIRVAVKRIQRMTKKFLWRRRCHLYLEQRHKKYTKAELFCMDKQQQKTLSILHNWYQEAHRLRSARRIATVVRMFAARKLLARMLSHRRAQLKKISMALGLGSKRLQGRCLDAWISYTRRQLDARLAARVALQALDAAAYDAARSAAQEAIGSYVCLYIARRQLDIRIGRRIQLKSQVRALELKQRRNRLRSTFHALANIIRQNISQRVTDAAENKSQLVHEFLFKRLPSRSGRGQVKAIREEKISAHFMAARRSALRPGVLCWQSDVLSLFELRTLSQLASCIVVENSDDLEAASRELIDVPISAATPKVRTKQAVPCQRKLIINNCKEADADKLAAVGRLVAQGAIGGLTIHQTLLTATAFSSIALALMTPSPCNGLHELSICNCNAGPGALGALLTALLERASGGLPALSSLSLCGNRLDSFGYDDNAHLLRRLLEAPGGCPVSLSLERMRLTPLSARQIALAKPDLSTLSLAGNPDIQDIALQNIITSLSSVQLLERLDLSDCGCGPQAANALLHLFEQNATRKFSVSLWSTALEAKILTRFAAITGAPEARCVLYLDPHALGDELPQAKLTGLKSPYTAALQGHTKRLTALVSNLDSVVCCS